MVISWIPCSGAIWDHYIQDIRIDKNPLDDSGQIDAAITIQKWNFGIFQGDIS